MAAYDNVAQNPLPQGAARHSATVIMVPMNFLTTLLNQPPAVSEVESVACWVGELSRYIQLSKSKFLGF